MPRTFVVVAGALVWGTVSPAAAGPPGGAVARPFSPSLVVRLAWTDPAGVTAGGWVRASAETARVLADMGLQAESRPAPVSEPLRSGDEIRVVLVPGAPPRRSDGRAVLGAASSSGLGPKIWVHSEGIAHLLGAPTPFRPVTAPLDDVIRFDIALGRVVAHEVVHLLVPALPHGRGLMAACADTREFVAPTMRVEPELAVLVQTALRTGMAATAGYGQDEPPALAALP
jgi:hypothetical protein